MKVKTDRDHLKRELAQAEAACSALENEIERATARYERAVALRNEKRSELVGCKIIGFEYDFCQTCGREDPHITSCPHWPSSKPARSRV